MLYLYIGVAFAILNLMCMTFWKQYREAVLNGIEEMGVDTEQANNFLPVMISIIIDVLVWPLGIIGFAVRVSNALK